MEDYEFKADLDEEDSDLFEGGGQWFGRDATIFLIDAASDMFKTDETESEECSVVKALRCVHSTVAKRVIGNDQDVYAIIFFNTVSSKNALDFPNIYVLQDLDRPGAERMLELENTLEEFSKSNPKNAFGSSESANIQDVLWVCRNSFNASKRKLNTKNILLFTCQDDPHSGDEHKQRQALMGARDLKDASIEIEILPMKTTFKANKFYKELLMQGGDESESLSVLADPTERFEELLERVQLFEHKQRSTGRILFTLAPGVDLGVKVFTFCRKVFKSKIKLYKVTNEEVVAQRKEFLQANGELLMPSDFVKYQEYGGKKIKFTLDEVKSMRKLFEPGMELLGFKKRSSFSPSLYVKPATFIYPDDDSVKGSSKAFSCLLERCVARGVCPLVRVTAREGGALSWAYLLPQEELKDEKGCQQKPPGFFVCFLPFADDFRLIEVSNRARAKPDQVDAAKAFVRRLEFAFDPDCFEDPSLRTHWRNIEALALNRQSLEPVIDYTVPNYKKIEKKAGTLIEAFRSLTLPPSYDADLVAKKRPASSAASASAPKKAKTDPASVEDMARRKQAEKLTVEVLKAWLLERGLRVTGKKKAQLVQDVYDELDL